MVIVIAIALLVLGVLLYASTKPDVFHVERSVLINATPDAIFPLINDLHRWDAWTPDNKDPAMKKTYSGSAAGVGAHYAWEGDATRVTWSLDDKHTLMHKVMSIFLNLDKMIGKDFAVGLVQLKTVMEQKG